MSADLTDSGARPQNCLEIKLVSEAGSVAASGKESGFVQTAREGGRYPLSFAEPVEIPDRQAEGNPIGQQTGNARQRSNARGGVDP